MSTARSPRAWLPRAAIIVTTIVVVLVLRPFFLFLGRLAVDLAIVIAVVAAVWVALRKKPTADAESPQPEEESASEAPKPASLPQPDRAAEIDDELRRLKRDMGKE